MAERAEFMDYVGNSGDGSTAWSEHSKWQHTTMWGKITLALMKFGNNSFISAIVDALREDNTDNAQKYVPIFANIMVVIVGVVTAYAIGKIIQIFVGKEIVINQEIIIEEEVKLSDLIAAKKEKDASDNANNENNNKEKKRRNARSKKSK
jgi:hypothetical protein